MAAVATDLRRTFPRTDEVVVSYIAGLVDDVDEEVDDIVEMTRGMLLGGPSSSDSKALEDFITRLEAYLDSQSSKRVRRTTTATRLDKTVQMRSQGMSATIAMSGDVDLSSVNKGQASRVDMTKLAKAEAKLQAKLEKRSRRTLYEGSKLIEAQKKQASFEEIFMAVNPLDLSGASRGKSKDIHLENIDISIGSLSILSGTELTMAHGRKYGLIGRNGIGKSTLLKNLALRELPIPTHISLVYVEQEVIGDDTPALQAVLRADVWRTKILQDTADIEKRLEALAAPVEGEAATSAANAERDELTERLGEIQGQLVMMDAETAPARASQLLSGLGFDEEAQHRPTKSFSGGWRMRISIARALFVKPDLLMLDEPSNHLDIASVAWLEAYLQEWPGTCLIVSHDRSFLDNVATDIVLQRNQRLETYRGNWTQFEATKNERALVQKREYTAQMEYRASLEAYIARWRYNANRAASAQQRIKVLEKLPDLQPPETEEEEVIHFPEVELGAVGGALLQLNGVTFAYPGSKTILQNVDFNVRVGDRIALVGPNGAGKSTLIKLLMGTLQPSTGSVSRRPATNIGYFGQHSIEELDVTKTPVAFLQSRYPGKTEQEYRSHLGRFGITGLLGIQKIGTLSGGQKSRVAFSVVALANPAVLLLDEASNHLDLQGITALIDAINEFKGGVIMVSHDEYYISRASNQISVCVAGRVAGFEGTIQQYKAVIVEEMRKKGSL